MVKLSTTEETVLKYLIENNGNGLNGMPINIPNIPLHYIIDAIKILESYGLVKNCSTLVSANAFLTEKGSSYFIDLEKEEYGELYDSIRTINSYIEKAKQLKTSRNSEELKAFIRQVFLTYSDSKNENAIHGLKTSFGVYAKDDLNSFYYDLDYIVMILTKIKDEKRVEAKALQVEKIKIENKNIIYNENTNTNTIDIKIDLIQVFNQINESKELSNDEKVELQQLIQNAIKEKDKKSLWEKIKNIFGKVADKTFDVAVAVLPVLAEAMLKAKGIL